MDLILVLLHVFIFLMDWACHACACSHNVAVGGMIRSFMHEDMFTIVNL